MALDPAADHGFVAGIHERHLPRLRGGAMHPARIVAHVEGDV